MIGPMTALEVAENEACAKIAEDVGHEYAKKDGERSRGAVEAATTISAIIRMQPRDRGVEPDPFTKCLYHGCPEDALGAFCKGHLLYVPHHVQRELAQAIVKDDHQAYGAAVGRARRAIDEAEAQVAAEMQRRRERQLL